MFDRRVSAAAARGLLAGAAFGGWAGCSQPAWRDDRDDHEHADGERDGRDDRPDRPLEARAGVVAIGCHRGGSCPTPRTSDQAQDAALQPRCLLGRGRLRQRGARIGVQHRARGRDEPAAGSEREGRLERRRSRRPARRCPAAGTACAASARARGRRREAGSRRRPRRSTRPASSSRPMPLDERRRRAPRAAPPPASSSSCSAALPGFEVRTSTNSPRWWARAIAANGSSPSSPRYGLTVSASPRGPEPSRAAER